MTEREKKCFDSHPIWKVAADGLPTEDGEYLVVGIIIMTQFVHTRRKTSNIG